jgi:hypothetical protein
MHLMRGLDDMARRGDSVKSLARTAAPIEFAMAHAGWIAVVSEWLSEKFPDSGLRAEWASLQSSDLGPPQDTPSRFIRGMAEMNVDQRLRWLANLPNQVSIRKLTTPEIASDSSLKEGRRELKLAVTSRAIVDPARIQALQDASHPDFDLSKLVLLCQEMNLAFATKSYLSMAMLTRAIIDHVPPIFGMKSFSEVANH